LLGFVPEGGIWRDVKFVRYADVRCKLFWWWVNSRNRTFS